MSFLQHAQAHIEFSDILNFSNAVQPFADNQHVTWHDVLFPVKLKLVFGHNVHEEMLKFFGHKCFMFTCLRPPLERLESQYFFDVRLAESTGSKPPTLDEFLKRNQNQMCAFIENRFPSAVRAFRGDRAARVVGVLKLFDLVIPQAAFDVAIKEVCDVLHIPPVSVRKNVRDPSLKLTPEELQRFEASIPLDLAVYQQMFATPEPYRADPEDLRSRRAAAFGSGFNREALEKFLSRYTFSEFSNWKRLDAYIEKRRQQRDALDRELNFMQTLIAQRKA